LFFDQPIRGIVGKAVGGTEVVETKVGNHLTL
jgi:hypothetical protein